MKHIKEIKPIIFIEDEKVYDAFCSVCPNQRTCQMECDKFKKFREKCRKTNNG